MSNIQTVAPHIDGYINIARSNNLWEGIGQHIKDWHNVSIPWEEFIEGLTEYAYSPVFMDEEQPGIVPGIIGTRETYMGWKLNKSTLGYTDVICFDVDNDGEEGVVSIEEFIHRFRFKYVLTTTKSHGKDKANGKDRYRVWIPVKNNILYQPNDKYARIVKRIASYIGLVIDDREVVLSGNQPKLEPSPIDSYIYVSKYEPLLDFDIELNKDGKSTIRAWADLPEYELPNIKGKIKEDFDILTSNYEVQKLSTFVEETQCFCPICEDDKSKTPSARVYVDEGKPNSVYCYKDAEHQRFVQYDNNIINNEGFINEESRDNK